MKAMLLALTLVGLTLPLQAKDNPKFDELIKKLTSSLDAMMEKGDKAIPAEQLKKAHGIILLDRTKAGFLFAYQGGTGIAMLKDPKSQKWGPASFMKATEASIGFQAGSQQSFMVILLMNANAAEALMNPKIDFAGEASGTADTTTSGTEAKIAAEPGVLIYDDRQGLYGGAAIKGGTIAVDTDSNRSYYGEYVTIKEILVEKKVKQTPAVSALAKKLTDFARKK